MFRPFILSSLTMLLFSPSSVALDWHVSLQASLEDILASDSIFFQNQDSHLQQVSAELSVGYEGLSGTVTARKQWYRDWHDDDLILNELFYDKSLWGWDFTLGKKRLDWGVGYSYRPLDIIKSYISQPTGITVEEGAWIVSAEYFTNSGTLSLIVSDSQTQQESIHPQQKGGGVRYYALAGDWDLQGVIYFDDVRKALAGGSAVTVFGDALSVHFSGLWQSEYIQLGHHLEGQNVPYPGNPVYKEDGKNALQLLSGFNYTFKNNINLLVEYWFDERSPQRSEWKKLIDAGRKLKQGEDVYGNLLASQNFFTTQNLVQHNLLIHTRYDGEYWEPVFDAVISPDDGGVISTARVRYTWYNGYWIEAGGRWFVGSGDSVFRQLPDKQIIFAMMTFPF